MGISSILTQQAINAALSPSTLRLAQRYLSDNVDFTTLIDPLFGKDEEPVAVHAAVAFASWLVNAQKGKTLKTGMDQIPLTQAAEVASALATAERLTGARPGMNVKRLNDGKLEIVSMERRVGLGVSQSGKLAHPVLVMASSADGLPGWVKEMPAMPKILVVGQVGAILPAASPQATLTVPVEEHRPGRSVAHMEYNAGSIGAYVYVDDKNSRRKFKGFVSASHVLSNMGRCKLGDTVLSPGYPDRARQGEFEYGHLANWRFLAHHSDQADPDLVVNTVDIGHANLIDGTVEASNQVPDPNDPSHNLLQVNEVMSLTDLADHMESEVFLIGRTTQLGKGRLVARDIGDYPIRMPNRKNYMFSGLALVESTDPNRAFSLGGDSGALVYALDGKSCKAVGFVVGGAERYTFIAPAVTSLAAMNATLL